MDKFSLYYLADQAGDINGDKTLKGVFGSLAAALAQALADGVVHYSIEKTSALSGDVSIVFIC